MKWWFKARRGHVLLPLALLVFGVALYGLLGTYVLLPALVGQPRVTLALFAPVPLLAFLMAALESRLPAAETSGVRSTARLDNALVTAVVAAAVLCSVLVCAAQGTATALAGGRNVVFLTGLMLLGRAWAGQTAVMIPVGWLVTVALTGYRANVPHLWTVVALPADNPVAAVASPVVYAVGLVAQIRSSRRTA